MLTAPHPLQSYSWHSLYIGAAAVRFHGGCCLALEHKRLPYESQLLHFDKQEHQSPQMLKLNPRGRVPVLKDGDYVVFESLAVLYYLDVKYPQAPIFGTTPEEAGVIMRVICEFQAYAEPSLVKIVNAIFSDQVAEAIDELTDAMHLVGREARTIEGRLSKENWIVGASYSATDMVIFPWIQLLRRALDKARGRRARGALPADGAKLPGTGALDTAVSNRCRATSAPTRRIGVSIRSRADKT